MEQSRTRPSTHGAHWPILLLLLATVVLLAASVAVAAGGASAPAVSASPHSTQTPVPRGSAIKLWDLMNVYAVDNGGVSPTVQLNDDYFITEIWTYHWNYGHGAQPGTISLRTLYGYVFGPWDATTTPGQGGVRNANWVVKPMQVIPAGAYYVIDSDPSTWSQNSATGHQGMTWAYGTLATSSPSPSPTTSPSPTPTPTPTHSPSPTPTPTQTPTPTPTPTTSPSPVDPTTGWTTQPSGTTSTLHGTAATDTSHSWAVGDGGTIVTTSNGGQTWADQDSGTTASLRDVFFLGGGSAQAKGISASRGWAVGDGGTILATQNGGASWAKQQSGTTSDLLGVTFTDAQRGYAVGTNGAILVTMNGGTSWTTRPSPGAVTLTDVTFADAMRGWAVGSGGTILSTPNAGATWTQQTSGSGVQLTSVSFANGTNGWAAGAGGTILSTTNGGTTWLPQAVGAGGIDLNAIAFVDAQRGFAVGAGGNVLTTQNGGITWAVKKLLADRALLGLVFPSLMKGWVVGQRGTILFTATGGTPPRPIISSLKPASGKRKAVVTVNGASFGATRGASYVRFGSAKCSSYLMWTQTKIICKVPAKAKKGKVQVAVTTVLGRSNAKPFKVK